MPRIYDGLATLGTYTDAEGQERVKWLKCGAVIRNPENGNLSLKLDALPVAPLPKEGNDGGIWLVLKKPTPYQAKPETTAYAAPPPTPVYAKGPDQRPPAPATQAQLDAPQDNRGFTDDEIPF